MPAPACYDDDSGEQGGASRCLLLSGNNKAGIPTEVIIRTKCEMSFPKWTFSKNLTIRITVL